MSHLNLADIAAYVSGQLKNGDLFELELHMADCDQCAKKIFNYSLIRDYFDAIWDELTLTDLTQDLIRINLFESILSSSVNSRLLPRIESWMNGFFNKTQLIAGIFFDISKKKIEILNKEFLPVEILNNFVKFQMEDTPLLRSGRDESNTVLIQRMKGINGKIIDILQSKDSLLLKIKKSKNDTSFPLIWAVSLDKGHSIFKESYQPENTEHFVAEFSFNELADLSRYVFFMENEKQKRLQMAERVLNHLNNITEKIKDIATDIDLSNLNDLVKNIFKLPTPRFAPVFGDAQAVVLTPFGRTRFPIIFEWISYVEATEYELSIEDAEWNIITSDTKIEVTQDDITLSYGREYLWNLKILKNKETLDEINGFFAIPDKEELKYIDDIENHLTKIKPELDRLLLCGGMLETKELYIEAVQKYKQAYEIQPLSGIAYRIAWCYNCLELEELRDYWNSKIMENQ